MMVIRTQCRPESPMVGGSYLRKQEAAKYLSISTRTLDELRKTKDLPFLFIGGQVRFQQEALDDWVQAQNTNKIKCADKPNKNKNKEVN